MTATKRERERWTERQRLFLCSACTCIKTGNPEIEYNQSQFCEMQFKHHAAFPNIPGYMRLHGRARNVQCMCTVFLRFSGPISLQPIVALSLELFLEFVVIRSSSLARWPAVPPGQQNTQVVKSQSRHGWHWVTKGLCDTVAINSTAQTTTTSARSICLLPIIMCSGFQFFHHLRILHEQRMVNDGIATEGNERTTLIVKE